LTGVKYSIPHTYFGIAEWSERSGDATTALVRRLQESDMNATVTAGQAHGHVYDHPHGWRRWLYATDHKEVPLVVK
jgi:hypothetical protein